MLFFFSLFLESWNVQFHFNFMMNMLCFFNSKETSVFLWVWSLSWWHLTQFYFIKKNFSRIYLLFAKKNLTESIQFESSNRLFYLKSMFFTQNEKIELFKFHASCFYLLILLEPQEKLSKTTDINSISCFKFLFTAILTSNFTKFHINS